MDTNQTENKHAKAAEFLNAKNIASIRKIARAVGVSSPTIYKKEELIERIIQAAQNDFTDSANPITRAETLQDIQTLQDIIA